MKNLETTKISSSLTKVMTYGFFIIYLFFTSLGILGIINDPKEFNAGMIIPIIIYSIFTFLVLYQLIFACEAQIIGNKIVLKKLFRAPKFYAFNRLRYPSVYRQRGMDYINIKMKNDDGSYEKYLILNSTSIFSSNKQAEAILKNIYSSNKDEIVEIMKKERALETV